MKLVLILASLASLPAFAQGPFLHCANIQMAGPESTEEKIVLLPSGFSITVNTEDVADHYSAILTQNGAEVGRTSDVQAGVLPGADKNSLALAKLVVPGFRPEAVKSVRFANVYAKQNQQDGGGMTILEMLDEAGRPLARVAQIGWSFGVCAP